MDEESIFLQALEHESPQERAAFLDRVCAGNEALRRSVDLLLQAHARAGDFLQHPGLSPDSTARQARPVAAGRLGPYKLLQQLGEGGMGTVWLAEQTEPVRRLVALKVVKPGLDGAQ